MSNKKRVFFYNMVEAEFFGFRNAEIDAKFLAMTEAILNELDILHREELKGFVQSYVLRLVYTINMTFTWKNDVPEEYRQIETWWNMTQPATRGVPISTAFIYFCGNVSNQMVNAYEFSINDAHKIWTPSEEKKPEDHQPETEKDPND